MLVTDSYYADRKTNNQKILSNQKSAVFLISNNYFIDFVVIDLEWK